MSKNQPWAVIRPFLASIPLLASCPAACALDLPTLEIISDKAIQVRHEGTSGEIYWLEISRELLFWERIGVTEEDGLNPGLFSAIDPSFLYFDHGFYRVANGYVPAYEAWMQDDPVEPPEGAEALGFEEFEWPAFPTVDPVVYGLDIYPCVPTGDLPPKPIRAAVPHPIYSYSGLAAPFMDLMMEDTAAELVPGREYYFSFWAETGGHRYRARPALFLAHGLDSITDRDEPPPAPIAGGGKAAASAPTAPPNFAQLMKLYNELAKKKQELMDALNSNPLVQEARLIEQLRQILSNHEALRATIQAILNAQVSALGDPENVLKALCYLDSLLQYLLDHDSSLSGAKRQALQNLATGIHNIKHALEIAEDRAAQLNQTIQDIQNLIQQMQALIEDPVAFILEQIGDRLLEKVRELLVKKLGEKAAGALFSIIQDLVNTGDALLNFSNLQAICHEMDRILLMAIAANPNPDCTTGRRYAHNTSLNMSNCSLTLRYFKRCWVPAPGGGPYDGAWMEMTVRLANGDSSITYNPVSGIITGPGPGGRGMRVEATHNLMAGDLALPPGQGPCIVYCRAEYSCPPPAESRTFDIFCGTIR